MWVQQQSLSVHDLSVIFVHKTTAMILSSGKGQLSTLYSTSKKLKKGVEAQIKRGRDTTGALKRRLGCAELSRNHPHQEGGEEEDCSWHGVHC
jgi:hypothetical protein